MLLPNTYAADDALPARPAKVRGNALPAQYDLARFRQNITNLHPTWTTYNDITSWYGVTCEEGEVTEIHWNGMSLQGTMKWAALPPTVVQFDAGQNAVVGTLETETLPLNLHRLRMYQNRLAGFLNFSALPPEIQYVNLASNFFTGGLTLEALPTTLCRILLQGNAFSGELDLSALPPKLDSMGLHDNNLEGPVELRFLPESLGVLYLSLNRLSGVAYLDKLPKELTVLRLSDNCFEGFVPTPPPFHVQYVRQGNVERCGKRLAILAQGRS